MRETSRVLAEEWFGPKRGRPTLSRRAGVQIARTVRVRRTTGAEIFHFGLIMCGLLLKLRGKAK